jgi:hypothetical protein
MTDTITAKISTDDTDWIAKHAAPGPEAGTAIITFTSDQAEPHTFCGHNVLRIDLKAIAGALPKESVNRWTAIFPKHILSRTPVAA